MLTRYDKAYQAAKQRRLRAADPEHYAAKSRAASTRRRAGIRAAIDAEKRGRGECGDCHEPVAEPLEVFEFDHRDPAAKLFTVGEYNGSSLVELAQEMAKCDLVCANCHRRRTVAAGIGRRPARTPQTEPQPGLW